LLEEVVGPIYLFGASATSTGQIPMTTFYVSVAGFNNEDHVCELRIPQPSIPALFGDERAKAYNDNQLAPHIANVRFAPPRWKAE
jgi:hypothetical protein